MLKEENTKLSITTGRWVRGVIVIVVAYMLFQVSEIFLVISASIIIASAIEPISVIALKRGWPRLPSVVLVYVLTALFLSVFFYFLLLPLISEVTSISFQSVGIGFVSPVTN